jgi:hypothetical protein
MFDRRIHNSGNMQTVDLIALSDPSRNGPAVVLSRSGDFMLVLLASAKKVMTQHVTDKHIEQESEDHDKQEPCKSKPRKTAFLLIIVLPIRRHVLRSRQTMRRALDRGLITRRSRSTVKLLEACITALGFGTLSTASYGQGPATIPRAV